MCGVVWSFRLSAVVVAGTGTGGLADATKHSAQFRWPLGLCFSIVADGVSKVLFCTDTTTHRVRRITLPSGDVSTYAGLKDSDQIAAPFSYPRAICAGPTPPGCFVGDESVIRYCSDTSEQSLVAGGPVSGFADGVGGAARFNQITGLIAARDGHTLYVCDSRNGRLRSVDLKAVPTVKTIYGMEKNRRILRVMSYVLTFKIKTGKLVCGWAD